MSELSDMYPVKEMSKKEISKGLIDFFDTNRKGVRYGIRWLNTKNPHFKNKTPAETVIQNDYDKVLNYVKKNMDPKVRARCLKYKSEDKWYR